MDIVDCILADHDRQRRLFAALEQARGNPDALGKIFGHLKDFLEAHAAAEERHFYPELLKLGQGALDSPSSEDTTDDAIGDHNEIAEAAKEAMQHQPGSAAWWKCVDEAHLHNSKHLSEEERQGLTDFRRNVPLEKRVELGIAYLAFEADHASGYERREKNPDTYIREHRAG